MAEQTPRDDHDDMDQRDDMDQQQDAENGPAIAGTTESALELIALQSELELCRDRGLRLQAEMENLRKRTRREIDEERQFANLPLIRDILPVMDNIDRAIAAAEKSQDVDTLLSGVRMMAQQLQTVLANNFCEEIQALHQPFDPHLHEAIAQQPAAEHPAGTVVAVAQAGYQLHGRVIRPSQVVVSVSSEGQA